MKSDDTLHKCGLQSNEGTSQCLNAIYKEDRTPNYTTTLPAVKREMSEKCKTLQLLTSDQSGTFRSTTDMNAIKHWLSY